MSTIACAASRSLSADTVPIHRRQLGTRSAGRPGRRGPLARRRRRRPAGRRVGCRRRARRPRRRPVGTNGGGGDGTDRAFCGPGRDVAGEFVPDESFEDSWKGLDAIDLVSLDCEGAPFASHPDGRASASTPGHAEVAAHGRSPIRACRLGCSVAAVGSTSRSPAQRDSRAFALQRLAAWRCDSVGVTPDALREPCAYRCERGRGVRRRFGDRRRPSTLSPISSALTGHGRGSRCATAVGSGETTKTPSPGPTR